MGCIAEIVYGTVECNGDCEHCHLWDESQERKYVEPQEIESEEDE